MNELFIVDQACYSRQPLAAPSALRALCAFNRINALACIKGAEHGWLGASFSVAELLTVLYFPRGERNVVLSKGHAAAMQYACLYGLGVLSQEQLLGYKDGPAGLPAHSERGTPGILFTSGSLGQSLSKAAALALCQPTERFFVILGDGELQEGQCFEALQTVAHRALTNLTVIVDLNGFQSELPVASIKRVADYDALLRGLGLDVQVVDGHDPVALTDALAAGCTSSRHAPLALLARTRKAGGTDLLPVEEGRQPWHGRVPDDALYRRLVAEQVERTADVELQAALRCWLGDVARASSSPAACATVAPPTARPTISTGVAFARRLERLVDEHAGIVVLDADLAHSCRLDSLAARSDRFYEMGIAEQDMVSFAGGLALAGRLPVVNTYAAFYKRAVEQIHVNQIDSLRVIYAGHYAGLCYFTDGKTHQSLSDLSLMLAVPELQVVEPVDAGHAEALLEWAVREARQSVYFRLRRTPPTFQLPHAGVRIDRPSVVGEGRERCFVTLGSVSTALALECRQRPELADFSVVALSVLRGPLDVDHLHALLGPARLIVTIEEELAPGPLHHLVCSHVQRLGLRARVVGKQIDRWGASFRTLDACRDHFGFRPEAIRRLVDRASDETAEPKELARR
jgi:transketolase